MHRKTSLRFGLRFSLHHAFDKIFHCESLFDNRKDHSAPGEGEDRVLDAVFRQRGNEGNGNATT